MIGPIVGFIDPGFSYNPWDHVDLFAFWKSQLFLTRVDGYHGDDLVWGRLGETDFRFSEVHALHKTVSKDKNGQKMDS